MTYDSASMDSSNFPPFTNPTGSGDVNARTWEDKVVLLYPYSAGMIHCQQQTSAPFSSLPNDPSDIPSSRNEPPIGGCPRPHTMVPHRLIHIHQQIENRFNPSTGPEFQTPRQPRPHTPTQSVQTLLLECLIPGCGQQFRRSDYLGKHLRKKHSLPIPKRQWAEKWLFRPENSHHYIAATQAQARENSCV